MSLSAETVWSQVLERLPAGLSSQARKCWINPMRPLRIEGRTLILECPNPFHYSWIQEHYARILHDALTRAKTPAEDLRLLQAHGPDPAPADEPPATQQQYDLPEIDVHQTRPLRLTRRFTFDRFVVGDANRYAYSAALALANGQDLNFSCLYILADHGLGKSHLSQALGLQALTRDQRKRILCLTAEDFLNEMVYSIKNRCVEDFKNKFRRGCDVLILEEIHFLSGKEKVQAELSYTLDCLAENGKRVVLTSAYLPKDIPRLGRQFASRLAGSLISSIEKPDYDTRLRILEHRAGELSLEVADTALELIAHRIKSDVRCLESCLCSLGARSQFLSRPIDLILAEEVLEDLTDDSPNIDPETILETVGRYYRVSQSDLKSKSRRREIVLPRNLAMYLCRRFTGLSLGAIGEYFDRNHSTVLYSINGIESRSRRDPQLRSQVDFLVGQINGGTNHV